MATSFLPQYGKLSLPSGKISTEGLGGLSIPSAPDTSGLSSILALLENISRGGAGGMFQPQIQEATRMLQEGGIGAIGPTAFPTYGVAPKTGIRTLVPQSIENAILVSRPTMEPPISTAAPTTLPHREILESTTGGLLGSVSEGLGMGLSEAMGPGTLPGDIALGARNVPSISIESLLSSMVPGLVSSIAQGQPSPSMATGPASLFGGYAGGQMGRGITEATGLPSAPPTGPGLMGLLGLEDKTAQTLANVGLRGLSSAAATTNPYAGFALPAANLISNLMAGRNISRELANIPLSIATMGIAPALKGLPVVGPISSFASGLVTNPLAALIQKIGESIGLAEPQVTHGTPESIARAQDLAGYYGMGYSAEPSVATPESIARAQNLSSFLGMDYGASTPAEAGPDYGMGAWDVGLGYTGDAEGEGAEGTVICTELNRQGILDDETYLADSEFGKLLPYNVLRGYRLWGTKLAEAMKKSKLLTKIVWTFAKPWTEEMAYKAGFRKKGNLFGKLMTKIGIPICGFIGQIL